MLPNSSTVNGLDISEQLISTTSDSEVFGVKTFNWTHVVGDLQVSTGVVNNINVTEMELKSLKKSSAYVQEVMSDQMFQRNLIIKGSYIIENYIYTSDLLPNDIFENLITHITFELSKTLAGNT